MTWLWLALAIVFEVSGTLCLKLSTGLTKLAPSILTFVFYFISFVSLAFALKKLELSVAYTIWAGLGTALIALISLIFLGESVSFLKILSIILIIAGVVGLNLAGATH